MITHNRHSEASQRTIAQIGETQAIRQIIAELRPAAQASIGPGDDAAVLSLAGAMVISTDTMIEGLDFLLAWHSGFALGWKLAATNLADIAAMGAVPVALTVAVACPGSTRIEFLKEVARGLDAACQSLAPGCGIVGGDLASAPQLCFAVTAVGQLRGTAAICRSGAAPGEQIAYCGQLGLAAKGLQLLQEQADPTGDPEVIAAAVARLCAQHPAPLRAQLSPAPPISAGVNAASGGATAMLDVSDGLSLDASRLARSSGITIDLSSAKLLEHFSRQGAEHLSLEMLLHSGEDHGFLAAFSGEQQLPPGFMPIGTALAPQKEQPLLLDGVARQITGWDSFAN